MQCGIVSQEVQEPGKLGGRGLSWEGFEVQAWSLRPLKESAGVKENARRASCLLLGYASPSTCLGSNAKQWVRLKLDLSCQWKLEFYPPFRGIALPAEVPTLWWSQKARTKTCLESDTIRVEVIPGVGMEMGMTGSVAWWEHQSGESFIILET